MNVLEAVAIIKRRFDERENLAQIPLLVGGRTFTAELMEDGITVSNLGNQPFLPWAVFEETISLLIREGGTADRGNAMGRGIRLGDEKLFLDSVEGHVAHVVYDKNRGEVVFRRITPIACILIWAGICEHLPGQLMLMDLT